MLLVFMRSGYAHWVGVWAQETASLSWQRLLENLWEGGLPPRSGEHVQPMSWQGSCLHRSMGLGC